MRKAQKIAAPTPEQIYAYVRLRELWTDDPVRYVIERFGMRPSWQQRKLLEAMIPEGAKVTCRAGHGVGKTGATSGAIAWFLETRDYARVPCTAPTSHQLRDVLWAEINKWARKSAELSQRRGDHPRFWLNNLFTFTNERIYDQSAPKEWFAIARTSGRDNPDALQGFHSSDVILSEDGFSLAEGSDERGKILFIVEEASGVYEKVFEVAEGALSSHGARLLLIGNPTRLSGYFHRSHHQDRAEFTALHFKSSESPLADPDYRKKLVRQYGEGSNVVRVRSDGEFPKQEDDVLISLEHTEPCIHRDPYDDDNDSDIRLGADVARYGDDRVALFIRQGKNLLHGEIHAKQATTTTTGQIVNLALAFGSKKIFIDGVGMGAGVVDGVREARDLGILPADTLIIDVQAAASAPVRENPYREKDQMVEAQGEKMRDYLWLEGKQWIENEAPSFAMLDPEIAEDLTAELTLPKYKIGSNGKLKVESKDEMKVRLRKTASNPRSPDLADAVLLTFAPVTDNSNTLILPASLTRDSSFWSPS